MTPGVIGAALAGPIADAFGASNAMLLFAIVATVPCLLVLAVPAVRAVRRRDRASEDVEAVDTPSLGTDGEVQVSRAS